MYWKFFEKLSLFQCNGYNTLDPITIKHTKNPNKSGYKENVYFCNRDKLKYLH